MNSKIGGCPLGFAALPVRIFRHARFFLRFNHRPSPNKPHVNAALGHGVGQLSIHLENFFIVHHILHAVNDAHFLQFKFKDLASFKKAVDHDESWFYFDMALKKVHDRLKLAVFKGVVAD
jgi:hypothetical protein